MLVHLAETWTSGKVRAVFLREGGSQESARGSGPSYATAADRDLLIIEPCAGVGIEQPPDAKEPIRRPFTQCDQNKILADCHLIRGIHQKIVGKWGGTGHGAPVAMVKSGPLSDKKPHGPERFLPRS